MGQKFKNFANKEYTKKETCYATPFSFKKIDRIISKGGKYNIQQRKNGGGKSFNTVNLFGWSWSYFYCFFIFIYVASFVFFSLLYYSVIVRWAHVAANENPEDPYTHPPKPCFVNVESYSDCFLFSVDTQTTIGPGVRVPEDHCPEVVVLVIFQSLWGSILNVVFTGMLLGRLAKPGKVQKKQQNKSGIIFSKFATITSRNGHLYLTFRVCEIKENAIDFGVNIRASCIQDVVTQEGENIPLHCQDMRVGCEIDGTNSTIPLMWPMIVSHRIDEDSPLFELDRISLQNTKLEIYIRLWGSLQGTLVSMRTSYTPREILWGYRFKAALVREEDGNMESVSLKAINAMETDSTPSMSAKELARQWAERGFHQDSIGALSLIHI